MGMFVIPVLAVLIAIGCIWTYLGEKKDWNKGHCSRCHSKWESFDTDSSGAIGYKCCCGRYIWISWIREVR